MIVVGASGLSPIHPSVAIQACPIIHRHRDDSSEHCFAWMHAQSRHGLAPTKSGVYSVLIVFHSFAIYRNVGWLKHHSVTIGIQFVVLGRQRIHFVAWMLFIMAASINVGCLICV